MYNHHLDTAVALALRGVRGANPLVGALIIDSSGSVVASGYHRGAGTPHAEADALANFAALPDRAQLNPAELTMVVTLEPCNHTGRTGPCSRAIIDAGIGQVVYAVTDTDPLASGGAETLRRAGVTTTHIPTHEGANQLNPRWLRSKQERRPFVSLKLAQSLDGKIAAADGTSQWITGPESRAHAHRVRAMVDAIVVGTGTVVADNPTLNARNTDPLTGATALAERQPARVIMGERDLSVSGQHYQIFSSPGGVTSQILTRDPHTVLNRLSETGVGHVLIEGGASIATAFLAADVVDEVYLYQAPVLIGAGKSSVGDTGTATLTQAWERHSFRFDPVGLDGANSGGVVRLGRDVLLHLEAVKKENN